ncbi:hypothetical protein BKA63DRAFT_428591 [Paraphoma chrysanthemicola]|nr:hypothetical protein BKA63DRAFT_428591 [Paraphoma chrysanthemicola]
MSENVWDTFDTYRLRQADLKAFLTELFGDLEFHISVEAGGIYRFLVPRALDDVIPSFLDFLFPFGKQVYARDAHFSGLREDSRFDKRSDSNGVVDLGRSGFDIRLCYNLRSVERSTGQPGRQWSIRQTAVYHEFDFETGRALWIFVKGNQLIKARLKEASSLSSSTNFGTRIEAFVASLAPHLLMCDWAGENWRWYINDLEDELQKLTRDVLSAQIDRPASPIHSALVAESSAGSPSRSSSFPMFSRSGTGAFSGKSRTYSSFSAQTSPSQAPTLVNNACSAKSWIEPMSVHGEALKSSTPMVEDARFVSFNRVVHSLKDSNSRLWKGLGRQTNDELADRELQEIPSCSSGASLPKDGPPPGRPGQEQNLTFKDLQQIQDIEEKAQEALLFLKSNTEILGELKQYYVYVTGHTNFPAELKKGCEADLARFNRCVLSVEKDLRMLRSRTETLIHLLGNRKGLLNGILQYRSAKASESSAKKAEVSANQMAELTLDMHQIAQKTKRETVSMRVITSVTLFFLPATFMATFMSTDILKFGDSGKKFQLDGLKLYLAVALPLTALTFLAWYAIYRLAGRGQSTNHCDDSIATGNSTV